jgi:ribokinase
MDSEDYGVVDVFGFGHCCIDYLCVLNPYPRKGKKGDVVRSLVIGGGPVPTALATVVKFGGSARFCGKVGDDADGRQVVGELGGAGVDIRPMVIDRGVTTARAYIWIDPKDGTRTIALDATGMTWLAEEQLNDGLPKHCRVLLTDGRATGATLKGLRLAREAEVTTVLDAGSVRPRFGEMLALVDYALVSRDLADTFAPGSGPEELARKLTEAGTGTAVVTAGEHGAYWWDGGNGGFVPGFKVEAYDSTGAGDVFHGAFIWGLLQGWGMEDAVRFANAAAALSCRKLSGRMGIPTLGEVIKLQSEQVIK